MPLRGVRGARNAVDRAVDRANENLRAKYFNTLKNVILQTPADTGRARNGWILTVGSPSSGVTRAPNEGGAASLASLAKMPSKVLGTAIYLTNSTPYIQTLEYGRYPSPVKKGSWISDGAGGGHYEKLSTGGWSNQLLQTIGPVGMARHNLQKLEQELKR